MFIDKTIFPSKWFLVIIVHILRQRLECHVSYGIRYEKGIKNDFNLSRDVNLQSSHLVSGSPRSHGSLIVA